MRIESFTGLANTITPESLPEGALVAALNVDIDDAGHLRRRRGTSLIATGKHHSLFRASTGEIFCVKDGDLCRLNSAFEAITIFSGIGNERLHYTQVGDVIYAKSSLVALRFGVTGVAEMWGVPHVPVFHLARTDGIMPAGMYQVAVTYVRDSDALEGGISEQRDFTLTTPGGINVVCPDLSGYTANVYLSTANGETLYRAATRVVGSASISVPMAQLGIQLRTAGKYPPVGRGPLAQSFGRIYIADEHVLWATDPFQYEQVDVATSYKLMEGRITFTASVTAGVYIGTTNGVFFMSGEFSVATLRAVSSHGAPEQVPQEIDLAYVLKGEQQGVGVLFMTDGGMCAGTATGEVVNLTNKQFEFPKASEVALLYRKQDGLNQFIGVSSHPGTPTGSARFGDFVDAEIIRHKET